MLAKSTRYCGNKQELDQYWRQNDSNIKELTGTSGKKGYEKLEKERLEEEELKM